MKTTFFVPKSITLACIFASLLVTAPNAWANSNTMSDPHNTGSSSQVSSQNAADTHHTEQNQADKMHAQKEQVKAVKGTTHLQQGAPKPSNVK